jgi:hypothetical protein
VKNRASHVPAGVAEDAVPLAPPPCRLWDLNEVPVEGVADARREPEDEEIHRPDADVNLCSDQSALLPGVGHRDNRRYILLSFLWCSGSLYTFGQLQTRLMFQLSRDFTVTKLKLRNEHNAP